MDCSLEYFCCLMDKGINSTLITSAKIMIARPMFGMPMAFSPSNIQFMRYPRTVAMGPIRNHVLCVAVRKSKLLLPPSITEQGHIRLYEMDGICKFFLFRAIRLLLCHILLLLLSCTPNNSDKICICAEAKLLVFGIWL